MLSIDISSLRQSPLFHDLEQPKLKLIALASQRVSYRIGDKLLRQGDKAEHVFVIMEGHASVLRAEEGDEAKIAELESGAVVGEMGVVLDRPYSSTVVADTAVTALRIDKRTFEDLLAQVPQFSLALIRELAARLVETSGLYAKALSK
jgi:CRP-like cAMP-binding protein